MSERLSVALIASRGIVDPAWVWQVRFSIAAEVLWMLVGRSYPDPVDPRALRRYQPDPFANALYQVIAAADIDHRGRLACIYPDHVHAWMIGEQLGGVELLREVMRRDDPALRYSG